MITSTIEKCEKIQVKFKEGTSQHTLLVNRIKALYISKALIMCDNKVDEYSLTEFRDSLAPISSIISKSEKAQEKSKEGATSHTRLKNLISAMNVSKTLIENEISKREA